MTADQLLRRPPAGDEEVEVVVLTAPSDLVDWTARTHVRDLPHGLFPRLGTGFTRRWHRAHLDSPHGIGFVALRDGVPIGFLLGSTDRRANVAWLVRHRRGPLARAALVAMLARPAVLADFLSTRAGRYARRLLRRSPAATSPAAGAPGERVAVLEAIVVVESERGRGVGTDLVEWFVESATRVGADRAELVTKAGAAGASGFYERRSWLRVESHVDRDGDPVATFRTLL